MLKKILRQNPLISSNYRILIKNKKPIFFEYDYDLKQRWTLDSPNAPLEAILNSHNDQYEANFQDFVQLKDFFETVERQSSGPADANWINAFLPPLDGMALAWAAMKANKKYIEIGSGNSTCFFHAAKQFLKKDIEITSIDPMPRRGIDVLCDNLHRKPLEDMDLGLFETLEAGDVVFVDNSHRSFMNSDVTVFMMDVLPRIPSGVLVGIHDIFLPYDYHEKWKDRYYNEQYLLACMLLANPDYFTIELPLYWAHQKGLDKALEPVWNSIGPDLAQRTGSAFWAVKN